MWNFKIGDMVVCIEDNWALFYHDLGITRNFQDIWPELNFNLPVKGCVYTIRDIISQPSDPDLYLLFEELRNPDCPILKQEFAFASRSFRPVKKTSIEDFQKLVSPTPKLEKKVKILENVD
jgi:hypothetical protein